MTHIDPKRFMVFYKCHIHIHGTNYTGLANEMEDYISPLSLPSPGNIHLGFGVGADALKTNEKLS